VATAIQAHQIKKLYAMAAMLGIVERGNKDDNFHDLVKTLTGKASVKDLDFTDYYDVKQRLENLLQNNKDINKSPHKQKRTQRYETGKNGITEGQCKKVWALMYQLAAKTPKETPLGIRLVGIIKKELKIDATSKDPLRWLTYERGSVLIEKIKMYIDSADKKAAGVGGI